MNIYQNTIEIRSATEESIHEIAILFNEYRVFYKKDSDLQSAKQFLLERFKNNESFIFSASYENKIVGFTQIYPTFSSLQMKKIYILNDLYVNEEYRSLGIGSSLITHVKDVAQKNNINTIILETASDNIKAKALYESLGFNRDIGMDTYCLSCIA